MNEYLIKFSRNNNNHWYLEQEDYYLIEVVRLRVFQLLKDTLHPIKNLLVLHKGADITNEIIKNIKL